MAPKDPEVLITVTIAGMDVSLAVPTPDQSIVLNRLGRALWRVGDDYDDQMNIVVKLLDAISLLIPEREMRDHIDYAVMERKIDVVEFLSQVVTALEAQTGQPAEAKKPVRRARKVTTPRARRGS